MRKPKPLFRCTIEVSDTKYQKCNLPAEVVFLTENGLCPRCKEHAKMHLFVVRRAHRPDPVKLSLVEAMVYEIHDA
jgi:hypothetical protein